MNERVDNLTKDIDSLSALEVMGYTKISEADRLSRCGCYKFISMAKKKKGHFDYLFVESTCDDYIVSITRLKNGKETVYVYQPGFRSLELLE